MAEDSSRIDRLRREELHELVQYLNLEEMRGFCAEHGLPLYIHVEKPEGGLRRTSDRDRKDIVLSRILHFALEGERSGPTVYPKTVVCSDPLSRLLTSRTKLRYGQYEKKNRALLRTLQELTGGHFRFGMIARIVMRDFWTAGKAPTLKQFAQEWLRATAAHTQPRPEGAYLADLARGEAGANWKSVRIRKAKRALKMLAELTR